MTTTYPEFLLDIAHVVKHPTGELIVQESESQECASRVVGTVALALDFDSRPVGFRLRALIEGWDQQRLLREMY